MSYQFQYFSYASRHLPQGRFIQYVLHFSKSGPSKCFEKFQGFATARVFLRMIRLQIFKNNYVNNVAADAPVALPIHQQHWYSSTHGELIFHDEKSITSASSVLRMLRLVMKTLEEFRRLEDIHIYLLKDRPFSRTYWRLVLKTSAELRFTVLETSLGDSLVSVQKMSWESMLSTSRRRSL